MQHLHTCRLGHHRCGEVDGEGHAHRGQELGAWETADMVRRYAHLTSEHLAPYVERFSQLRVVHPEENVTDTLRAVSYGRFVNSQTFDIRWRARRDSNTRPLASEANTLSS